MREQSIACGTEIITETVDKVDLQTRPYKLFIGDEVREAHSVIIATGATAKRLFIPGEEEYWQKGMSACAVCDGAAPIFRNKVVVVVGGGDSACEEATFLTKYAAKVIMLVRRDQMRASKVMALRAQNHPKIEVMWNTAPVSVSGDGKLLSHVRIKDTKTGDEQEIAAEGFFYAIGHVPNTEFLEGQLETDETGYLTTKPGTTQTSKEGVFACGDVQDHEWRQAVTAAGTGCMSALEAERWLTAQGLIE